MSTENNQLESIKSNTQITFNFFDADQFATMQRVCKMFANSDLVPDMYKVSETNSLEKAIGNCMIAIEIAQRIGASPLMIMQNMVPIYGKPSWSSKFLIATVNTCGRFAPLKFKRNNLGKVGKISIVEYKWNGQKKAPVQTEFDGTDIDNIECIAYTTAKGSSDILEGAPVSIRLAIEEGWYTKSGSKWRTMRDQMLMYRAASFWTNAYAPDLSMGMKTQDEVIDIEDIAYEDVTTSVDETIRANANKEEMKFDDEKPEATSQENNAQTQPETNSGSQEQNPI